MDFKPLIEKLAKMVAEAETGKMDTCASCQQTNTHLNPPSDFCDACMQKAAEEQGQDIEDMYEAAMCEDCGSSPCVCEGVGLEEEILDEVTPPGFKKEHPGLMSKLKKEYPGEPGKAYATAWKIQGEEDKEEMEEGKAKHTIEAYGVKGMDSKQWRKTFKDADDLNQWLEKNDAEMLGMRELEGVDEDKEEMEEGKAKHTIEAYGVKGMDSKQWRKTFKDADDLNQWLEKNDAEMLGMRELEGVDEDIYESELASMKRMMECWGPMNAPVNQSSGMNVTTNVDSKTGTKTVTITADGEGAEELMKILTMSGIAVAPMPTVSVEEELANQPNPKTLDAKIQMVDMAGGPNAPHGQYNPHAARDNSMSMVDESVDQLAQNLRNKFMNESKGEKTFKVQVSYDDPSGKGIASKTHVIKNVTDAKHAKSIVKDKHLPKVKNGKIVRATEVQD